MATEAARKALADEAWRWPIGLVVAATGTPMSSPRRWPRGWPLLRPDGPVPQIASYDIIAACSGYIDALDQVFAFLSRNPHASAMVITAEILSPSLDLDDPDTAVIFADAATVTVVHGAGAAGPVAGGCASRFWGNPSRVSSSQCLG